MNVLWHRRRARAMDGWMGDEWVHMPSLGGLGTERAMLVDHDVLLPRAPDSLSNILGMQPTSFVVCDDLRGKQADA